MFYRVFGLRAEFAAQLVQVKLAVEQEKEKTEKCQTWIRKNNFLPKIEQLQEIIERETAALKDRMCTTQRTRRTQSEWLNVSLQNFEASKKFE